MKHLSRYLIFVFVVLLSAGAATNLAAQDAEEQAIRARILERVNQVDALKLAKKVGENNVGQLEQRGQLSGEETRLMNQENADRRALYTILAKRVGVTVSVVGQGRAEELRRRSAPGIWLQDRGGNWYLSE